MLLLSIALLLSFLSQRVFASSLAAPYQTLYYWHAYRMEIAAFGLTADSPSIAPLCRGTAPGRACYFDEFLDYLQRDKMKLAPGQATAVGRKSWPDAITTAASLKELKETSGKALIPNQDPKRLFKPGTFSANIRAPQLADILDKVTDKIQAIRRAYSDEAVGITKEGLAQARIAMKGLHQARVAEQGQKYFNILNDYLKKKKSRKYTIDTKTLTAVDGTTRYEDVDIDKTTAKNPNFKADYKDFQTWMGQQSRTATDKTVQADTLATVKRHWDAVQAIEKLEARINGDPSS